MIHVFLKKGDFQIFLVSGAIWGLGTVGISTIMACRDAEATEVSEINDM